jgi:YfiH family protein
MMVMPEPQPNRAFEWTQAPWGVALRCVPLATLAPHWFTIGNLQLRDDRSEWNALAAAMQVEPDAVRLIRQVHGASVAVARSGNHARWTTPEADAAISDDPRAAICVRVADCAPILLADRTRAVVGAVHAGWRGTAKGVASEAVRALCREFGSRPADLVAAIGPCLGACCGEVGEEVIEVFRQAGHTEDDLARWFAPGPRGRPMFDLVGANTDQLRASGVPSASMHAAGLCTKTNAGLMHSYRAAGTRAGRMAALVRASSGA